MSEHKLLTMVLAVVMILSLVALPGMAAAGTGSDGESDDEGLSINVVDVDDGYLVTVTENGEGIEGIDVIASVDDMAEDEVPEENEADDDEAGNDETDTYTTDKEGAFSYDEPETKTTVTFEATVDNEEIETTETLGSSDEEESENFGSIVSTFVEETKDESDGPLGIQVAGFVVEKNPGNAPAHAGPPGHAGPPSTDSEKGSQGPPEHAGGDDDDDSQAPPEHAGNGNNGGGPPGQSDE